MFKKHEIEKTTPLEIMVVEGNGDWEEKENLKDEIKNWLQNQGYEVGVSYGVTIPPVLGVEVSLNGKTIFIGDNI